MNYRWILGAALLAVGTGATLGAPAAQPSDAAPSVLVTLTALHPGSLARTVSAYGVVQPGAAGQRTVMAPASQTVGAVYVRAGQAVAAGAPLLQLVPSPETAAAYAQARSALQVARQLATRTQQMYAQHLATAQQLADAQKAASDARANLAALNAQGAGAPSVLRAPFRAIVLRLSAAPGALVAAGTPLLDLARPEALVLKAGVTPQQAALIQRGEPASIAAVGDAQRVAGRVVQRGALIDPASGLVPVEIGVPAGHLLPGQTAEVTITVGQTHGYVVPHAALLVDEQGAPYVVQANGTKARKVPVRVLGAQGDEEVIDGAGLNAGQPLVLSGNYQLDDGMRLRVAAQGAAK
ncbi:efflux RND transporter periplasmic adaptor subunit [Pandoraea sp.]|uniref:efflux RND transporter periplasmic adaptor subunit n=1 Tax=Pandoraea sp. TaxID=1883445 RepID=UPI0012090609|nr:efflux RND transporter periplasmic adaptor subunit [Pandoraea sp.]TAL52913.1 MAG: efflux RND transporter periplasmic adaptor subunit [Pandoraea sp.]TAM19584.1 MAG: efflux RND transporter periplasmic adaptor subunit [Pandoraea sp.]